MDATKFLRSKYLTCGELLAAGSPATMRIAEVSEEGERLVLHFDDGRALLLDRRQTRRMVDLYGAETDGWPEQVVILTALPTRLGVGGIALSRPEFA